MAAGYFGGRTAELQGVRHLELQRKEKTLPRSYAMSAEHETAQQHLNLLLRRLLHWRWLWLNLNLLFFLLDMEEGLDQGLEPILFLLLFSLFKHDLKVILFC